jgi:8-oxo-dGTP pyrophosphatase MutT (NUDIX family)
MYEVFIDNTPHKFHVQSEQALLRSFSDHLFIEAAGGVVERDGRFLFIKRLGHWDIPKGKLDAGESPEAGGVREVEEECGIVAPKIVSHLCNTWHAYEKNGVLCLKKTWWYRMVETKPSELVPQTEEGITEIRFFSRDEISGILKDAYGSIRSVVTNLFNDLDKK